MATTRPPLKLIPMSGVHPKALYLSVFGVANRTLREAALELLATTELPLVISVWDPRVPKSGTASL